MNYYLLSYLWILSLSPLSLSLFFTIIYEGFFLLIVCFFIGIFLIIVVIIITTTNILHTGRESVFTPTYQIWFDRWAIIGKYVFLFVCLFVCFACFIFCCIIIIGWFFYSFGSAATTFRDFNYVCLCFNFWFFFYVLAQGPPSWFWCTVSVTCLNYCLN